MGKTAQGAVWLNADLLSPYDYWQFWRNTDDADVGTFLRRFTDLPLDQVKLLEALQGAEINQAKIALATAATAMLHGEEAARAAADTAKTTFESGGAGDDLPRLMISGGTVRLTDALTGLKLCVSKGEARRLIRQGGARIDGIQVLDENFVIHVSHPVRVSAGRKSHGVLVPEGGTPS
jgi:tyrosyl-tRNA synthetase